MVQSLPETYRQAIVLSEFEGLTQKELAARLDLSLSGAKSRVQRGRAQLKKMLLDCCRFEFDRRGTVIECEPRRKTSCPECGPPDNLQRLGAARTQVTSMGNRGRNGA
jgi:RNA polymerase sigma-70 factor (ECF subfamily)